MVPRVCYIPALFVGLWLWEKTQYPSSVRPFFVFFFFFKLYELSFCHLQPKDPDSSLALRGTL